MSDLATRRTLARARQRQRLQNRTADNARKDARRLWLRVDTGSLVDSWSTLVPALFATIVGAQLLAGRDAEGYVDGVLIAQGLRTGSDGAFAPDSLLGVAADGSDLMRTLMWPAWAAMGAVVAGAPIGRARAAGLAAAELTAMTQVQDAFRVSAGAAAVTRPAVRTWVRALSPPSCSRCIVLAGSYSWSTAFQRHPRCDCVAIPSGRGSEADFSSTDPMAYFDAMSREEQDQVFGAAGAEAIRDGADMGRVVNARRKAAGISTAADANVDLLRRQGILDDVVAADGRITFAGTSDMDRRDRRVRVMPETIYRVARDREHAIDLLRANGFITEDWRSRLMRTRGFV